MDFPADLRYSSDHEWVRVEGARARIGITDYAQDALGDVVFVSIPALGASVRAGDGISEIESTKSVSDIYAPVTGTVAAVNETLTDHPDLVNSDPYGDGWLCEIELAEGADVEGLLDAEGYRALVEG